MLVCAFSGVSFFFFSAGSFSKLPHNISVFFFLLRLRFPLFVIPFFPRGIPELFHHQYSLFCDILISVTTHSFSCFITSFLFSHHLQYHPSKPHLPFLVEYGFSLGVMRQNNHEGKFPSPWKIRSLSAFWQQSLYAHQTKPSSTVVLPFLLPLPFS